MNDRELHQRASALFLEIRELPPRQREQRLQSVQAEDHRLRHEIESLLEHDHTMNARDRLGPGGHDGHVGDVPTRDRPHAQRGHRSFVAGHSSLPDLPERIGPYRVIERIGRGGSGFVMLAEQDEPVHRRVAIKIVPHAAIDADFAARFEVERRALERTDHPNIARILDAGRTADGLPYLVMDLVRGRPITEHCRAHSMSLRRRIELMLDVADAIQHAHQRGVIHRDLKPANILVSEDVQPDRLKALCRPMVLDFGIAKPIPEMWGPMGAAASPPTAGIPLGTPAYMAPEQTGGPGGSHAVDTRTDVYALGAVLYELACGWPPNDIAEGDPVESLRRIRETIPPAASRVRRQSPAEFSGDDASHAMLSDLDCILARALEKEPARRYPTVSAFADDLRRLLAGQPIAARPATLGYRAMRFAQRNRVLVASIAIVVLAMTIGVAGLATGLIEARTQRLEALNQTDAQREINRFLTDDLLAAASPEEEGTDITALDLLQRAAARVDARFATRPAIAASIHHTIGSAFSTLGEFESAQRHLDRAMQLRTATLGPNAPDAVRTEIALASLLVRRQKMNEARVALIAAVTRARLILGPDDPALYAALHDLGLAYETLDRGPEAVAMLHESLAGRRRLLGATDPHVLITMSSLAMAYERVGEEEKSLEMQLEALRIAEAIQPPPRYTILSLNNNVGATYQDLNRDQEAAPYLRKAADLARDWLGEEHPDTLTLKANLAGLEAEIGDPALALRLLDEVIRIRTRDLGPTVWDTLSARYAYWNAMWKAKRFDEAAAGLEAFLPDAQRSLKEDHWFVVQTRAALALALLDGGHPQQALPHAEKAVAQFTALYGPAHKRTENAARTLKSIQSQLADGD